MQFTNGANPGMLPLDGELVNLEYSSVSNALDIMIAAGYLTPTRKEEILVGKAVV